MSEAGARVNPYVGPRSIRTGERMYGRDREASQLFNLLLAERIVLLYSPSGAGKSSLLNAGLIPRLREEGFRIRPTMRVGMEPPGDAPAGANRHVLSALLSLEEDAKDSNFDLKRLAGQTLASYLERGETEDPDAAEVIVIDQFEEVLTAAPADIAAKQAFFAQLGAALRDERLWLIIAMREDFIAGLDPYRGALPTGLRTTFRLDLLGKDAALAAIKGPAAAAGVAFRDVAAEKLANDLREVRVPQADGSVVLQPGPHIEPVQLQVVCRSLWQQLRPEDREIGLDNLARLGDVDAALATYYDAQVEAAAQHCALPERALRQWIARHLVTANGLRTQVLQMPNRTQGLDNAALTALVDAHLLRTDTRRGMTWFELGHDRIIKPLQESNARWFLAKLSPVQRQAELWSSRGRPEGLLLTSAEEAERLLAAEEARPDTEREFLEQSRVVRRREAAAARNRLLLRVLTILIVVIAVAWLCVGYVMLQRQGELQREAAFQQAKRAEEAERAAAERLRAAEADKLAAEDKLTRQLVAQVALHRDSQPELAALLGVAASSRLDGVWARKAALINIGVTAPHRVARISLSPPWEIDPAGLSATLRPWKVAAGAGKLYAIDRGGQVWRITADDRRAVPLLPPGLMAGDFAAHPDEPLLALGGRGTIITLWDVAAGAERGRIELPGDGIRDSTKKWVEGLAFAADGRSLLAVQSVEGRSPVGFVIDLATSTAQRLGIFNDVRDPSDLGLSADGKIAVLTTGSNDGTIFVYAGSPFKRSPKKLACMGPCAMRLARFSPDGTRLLTGGDGVIALWNVDKSGIGEALRVVPLGAGETVRDALFMGDGTLAVLSDRRISLWRADNLDPWGTPIVLPGSGVQVLSQAGARGELIAAASNADAPVDLFDPRRLAPRGVTPRVADAADGPGAPFRHARVLAALDPSGATLATTDFEVRTSVEGSTKRTTSFGHVTLHDLAGAAPEQRLTALAGDQFAALRFTHRGARLVVADAGGKLTAWDVAARQWTSLGTLPRRGHEISLGATAEGELLAAVRAADGLWIGREAEGFAEMKVLGDAKPAAVAFDGEGRRVALARCTQETRPGMCSRGTIDIHDIAAGGPARQRLAVGFEPRQLVFSADGARLACSDGQRIKVWNLADGRALPLTVRADLGTFNGLELSVDGEVLVVSAVAGNAATDLVLWHIDSGEELAPPLRVHNPAIAGTADGQVLISADGKRIVSAACDGTVVWDIDEDSLRSRACALAGRELTLAEQQRFLGTQAYKALCPGGR